MSSSDFDRWNSLKKNIHFRIKNKFYHERDVWRCSFGANIGNEQDGRGTDFQRPVLVLKGLSRETCLVAPLTTSKLEHKYKKFKGERNVYRVRKGDVRIIYKVEKGKKIFILAIERRTKGTYRKYLGPKK